MRQGVDDQRSAGGLYVADRLVKAAGLGFLLVQRGEVGLEGALRLPFTEGEGGALEGDVEGVGVGVGTPTGLAEELGARDGCATD